VLNSSKNVSIHFLLREKEELSGNINEFINFLVSIHFLLREKEEYLNIGGMACYKSFNPLPPQREGRISKILQNQL
jgi:hypothetical protein